MILSLASVSLAENNNEKVKVTTVPVMNITLEFDKNQVYDQEKIEKIYDFSNVQVVINGYSRKNVYIKDEFKEKFNAQSFDATVKLNVDNTPMVFKSVADYSEEHEKLNGQKIKITSFRFIGKDKDTELLLTNEWVNDNMSKINGSGIITQGKEKTFFAVSNFDDTPVEVKMAPVKATQSYTTEESTNQEQVEPLAVGGEYILHNGGTSDLYVRISMNRENIIRAEDAYVAGAFAAKHRLSEERSDAYGTAYYLDKANMELISKSGANTIITTHPFKPIEANEGNTVSIGFSYMGFGPAISFAIGTSRTFEGSTGGWDVTYQYWERPHPIDEGAAFEGWLHSDKEGQGTLHANGEMTWEERQYGYSWSQPYYFTRGWLITQSYNEMDVEVVSP